MVTSKIQSQPSVRRTRRSHHKSRNGCFECKRRKVKCDEMRPSCTRCTLLLDKCIYPSGPQSTTNDQGNELPPTSSSCSIHSLSPISSSYSERSPSFEASIHATATYVDADCYSTAWDLESLSDADLYTHYLQHTSRTLTPCQNDRKALQVNLPQLALQHKTVFHSLLAVSAACLCCDIMSRKPAPETSAVNQALMAGYQHYNQASERLRESISHPGPLNPEPLLASAVLLVPFATASQQINHWISTRRKTEESEKPLSTTPRDVIIIMRAIRTSLNTLDCNSSSLNLEISQEMESAIDSSAAKISIPSAALAPSHNHVMRPIIAATSQSAFSKLQQRLDSALLNHSDDPQGLLSACSISFGILKYISSKTFSISNRDTASSLNNLVEEYFEPEPAAIQQLAPWLRSFARRATCPLPTEPLTSFFFSFLVQAPQAYLDLVLPLLDQRLESPVGATSDNISVELTREQALALDIYAHWSVLMFLVEEDSWWIGKLPVVTLAGMVYRYGDDFVTKLWPENGDGETQWWPGSMLNILREIKRYQ